MFPFGQRKRKVEEEAARKERLKQKHIEHWETLLSKCTSQENYVASAFMDSKGFYVHDLRDSYEECIDYLEQLISSGEGYASVIISDSASTKLDHIQENRRLFEEAYMNPNDEKRDFAQKAWAQGRRALGQEANE